MQKLYLVIFTIIVIAVAHVAKADDDDYDYMPTCDNRCEMRHRLNPFAEGCDDCCRGRGYRKGKCKGFGWSYCMCKRHGQMRQLLNSILGGQLQQGYQQHGYGYQG